MDCKENAMDKSSVIIGGASGYVEIEIDDSFTCHPDCGDIQMIEKKTVSNKAFKGSFNYRKED